MYANRDPDFYASYARALGDVRPLAGAELATQLSDAFNSVYRLVAFDIDGTLTSSVSPEINEDSARLIASLLSRGVEVLLITGRGRTATRSAAEAIVDRVGHRRQFQRLSAVTSNGMYFLETGPDEALLQRETALHPGLNLDELSAAAVAALNAAGIPHSLSRQPIGQTSLGALRVDLVDPISEEGALAALADLVTSTGAELSSGQYGEIRTIDLTPTNKADAIAAVAHIRGIDHTMVLRVGDRGAAGQNDWAMLNSPAGFTVGSCSGSCDGCWPVLNDRFETIRGIEATRALIDGVLLFAPLSLAPENPGSAVSDLLKVEQSSQRRARVEWSSATKRLQETARTYAPEDDARAEELALLQLRDLYDPWSGAVRLRDWEIADISLKARRLFALPEHEVPPPPKEASVLVDVVGFRSASSRS